MKNVCIIGCGCISSVHIEAVKKSNVAHLYGICDIDKRKKKIADDLGIKFFDSFDNVLLDKAVDAVHICTPHYLHFSMIKNSIESGKMVVCEKPAVMTKAEFELLKNIHGIEKVCFVMQNRLNTSIQKLKNIIDTKVFGNITGINAILLWNRTKEYYKSADWRGKLDTEGGGVLINQSIHNLDLLTYLAGNISSVRSYMTNYSLTDYIEVEDTCVSYIKFQSGIKGVFFATNANAGNDALEITVYFENGNAKICLDKLFINGELNCENTKATVVGKEYWGSSHDKLISDFYDQNEFYNISSIENTMNAMFAMYESAELQGKEIII